MIRVFDVIFSLIGLVVFFPILILLWLLIWFDTGVPLLRQERVGRFQKPFILLKFRTMRLDTVLVATHLNDPSVITNLGRFLRRAKLDELPQLWNVLIGEMSLVGPRPCLFNQYALINERVLKGIFNVTPGLTGLAQINNVDMSDPRLLVEMETRMLKNFGVRSYFSYIIKTLAGAGRGDRISKG